MRAVILDRDGTLIDVVRDEETGTTGVAYHPSQVRLLPYAVEGLRALRDGGYSFAIATNQPGPAKGQFSVVAVERTNRAVVERLAEAGVVVQTVQVCMHHPVGGEGGDPSLVCSCSCRKPGPLLLERAATVVGAPIADCWMIGDHPSDIAAAHHAGARGALVFDTRRCELCPLKVGFADRKPEIVGANLLEIANGILAG